MTTLQPLEGEGNLFRLARLFGQKQVPDGQNESSVRSLGHQRRSRIDCNALVAKLVQQLEGIVCRFRKVAGRHQSVSSVERLLYHPLFFKYIRERPIR